MIDKTKELDAEHVIRKYAGAHAHCTDIVAAGVGVAASMHVCAPQDQTWASEKVRAIKNTAGQYLECPDSVTRTLSIMELRLQNAFEATSHPLSTHAAFIEIAAEVMEDIRKLSPAFNIISGGDNGHGTENCEMIVQKKRVGLFKREYITLTQALRRFKND